MSMGRDIKSKRRIAVITGTRAEYGLLRQLLLEIKQDDALQLQLIVTGMHLSPEFGLTYQLIENDDFTIDAKVEMLLSSDTGVGIAKSVGLGVLGFSVAFDRLKPDLIIVLGDRFEILAAAQVALFMKIPIAHIHGGELSVGALDDSIRHSITKMSHLHFTAAESYRQRVIQLGEDPKHVYNVGAPGIERLKKIPLLDKKQLEKVLQIEIRDQFFLVTYHPETASQNNVDRQCQALFSALDCFPDASIIITRANADEAGRQINYQIDQYASRHENRIHVYDSMGDINYLSAMQCADVVIGNSSSGIIEAPSLKTATVNIGCRQDGRLRADSVIDCAVSKESIFEAIEMALSVEFQSIVKTVMSPYDSADTTSKILDVIKSVPLEQLTKKVFYDNKTIQDEKSAETTYIHHC